MNPFKLINEKERSLAEKTMAEGLYCSLAMPDGDGIYLTSLSYGYADGRLYFHSGSHGHKMSVLEDGKRAAFTILTKVEPVMADDPCKFSMHYHSLLGEGRLELLTDTQACSDALNAVVAQYGGKQRVYEEKDLTRIIVYALKIDKLTFKQH